MTQSKQYLTVNSTYALANCESEYTRSKVGLESTLEKICSCIREERAERIGLYGLGGVGKTTLLKQINNNFADLSKVFNVVIWVVVSQNFVLGKVQDQIWKQIRSLDDQWKSQSTEDKAVDIFTVLRKRKFLLLLDDLWKPIDFVKVAVPLKQKGSQVIFTTRFMAVCHQMEAQLIKVEPLQWPEAWALFQEKVGPDTLTSDERIAPLAESVAKKFGGLPIALITVGRAMAGKKPWQAWEHAIKVLTKATSSLQHMDDEELFQNVEKEVLALLKYSYDNSLPNDRVKSCFLYCTLFPEDYKIDKQELIDLWICETFWGGYDDLTEARNKGYDILDFLIRSCLIEEEMNSVKIHDVIRGMALWITHRSKERKGTFLVQAGVGLDRAPAVEKWEGISRMSLMCNSIAEVEEVPTCPDVLTLFLSENGLNKLPNGFFQSMKALTVLDLSYNSLRKLPSELSALVSLQCLHLRSTEIEELPLELQQLKMLKHLDVECCRELKKIPKQVIFGLASLKVLKLKGCNSYAKAEDNIFVDGDVHMEVLLYLQEVISELSLSIRSQSAFENISSTCRLLSRVVGLSIKVFDVPLIFDISCLGSTEHLDEISFEYLYEVKEMTVGFPMEWIGSQGSVSPHGSAVANTEVCFKSLTQVSLVECYNMRNLTWVALVPNLRDLNIQWCMLLQEVVNEEKLNDFTRPFAKLELLFLWDLPDLKSIFRNPLPFSTLKKIIVFHCPMLKKLPLNSESAKGCNLVIEGNDKWWEDVEWEDHAAKLVFQPSFRRIS